MLYSLVNAHPEFAIRALVRDSAKAQAITRAFPNVQVVEGSLDDEELMAQEAGKANIILRKTFLVVFRSPELLGAT